MKESKAMTLEQFNKFMKRCNDIMVVRYVTPTIHVHFKIITAIEISTSFGNLKFSITNNSDENFVLDKAVNTCLDGILLGLQGNFEQS